MQQSLQSLLGNDVARVRRIDVLDGPSGRRNWPDETKAAIVAETLAPGVRVSQVAARHRVSPQQVTTWRRLVRDGKLALPAESSAVFAPIVIAEKIAASAPSECAPTRWIEIAVKSVTVRVPEDVSPARIAEIALRLAR